MPGFLKSSTPESPCSDRGPRPRRPTQAPGRPDRRQDSSGDPMKGATRNIPMSTQPTELVERARSCRAPCQQLSARAVLPFLCRAGALPVALPVSRQHSTSHTLDVWYVSAESPCRVTVASFEKHKIVVCLVFLPFRRSRRGYIVGYAVRYICTYEHPYSR